MADLILGKVRDGDLVSRINPVGKQAELFGAEGGGDEQERGETDPTENRGTW